MKILLVRPNWTTRRMIMPPLGLQYIVAAVKRAGHECIIHDAWLKDEKPADAAWYCSSYDADIIGVQVYQDSVSWTRKFFHFARDLRRAKFIVGGPYVTALREKARIEMNADAAVIGEFETDIDKHLNEIMAGKTLIEWTEWIDVNEHPFPDWDS